MYLLIISIVISAITWIYLKNNRESPKRILGIYSVEGRWFYVKYFAMLMLLKLRKYSSRKKSGMGYGVDNIEKIEQIQPLSSDKKAFDAVFYHGVTETGFYFVGGVERRHNAKVNALVYLLIPEIGVLHSEHMPKTELNADTDLKNSFAGGGISFTPISPMRQWDIAYEGKMWVGEEYNRRWHNVKFEAVFTSDMPHFVVDTDSDRGALARALAKEIWTKEFFETLENAHQTHYEQMGTINAKITIDDKVQNVEMMGFRDHSFGHKRDWTMLHRYIFHMFYMDDGTRISCGVVSQPCSISHFEIGYVVDTDKKLYPIQECDLKLYQHGENGNPPKALAFSFTSNNENYDCKVAYKYDSVHYKGNDVEAKLFQRFFTCEVNGLKGRGISDWHYNNVGTYTSVKNNQ